MAWVLVVLVAAYLVVATLSGLAMARMFGGRTISHAERLVVYRHSIVNSWIAAISLGVVALATGHSLASLGLSGTSPERFEVSRVFAIVVVIGCGLFLLFEIGQILRLHFDGGYRGEVWAQVSAPADDDVLDADDGADGVDDDGVQTSGISARAGRPARDFTVELLVPRSVSERRIFYLIAFTAGVCEEFIFRGIMFAAITDAVPGISPYVLAAITAILFGIPHAYQGLAGIGKTTAAGLAFGCLYAATGTLIPGMILHGVVDLANAFLWPGEQPQR